MVVSRDEQAADQTEGGAARRHFAWQGSKMHRRTSTYMSSRREEITTVVPDFETAG